MSPVATTEIDSLRSTKGKVISFLSNGFRGDEPEALDGEAINFTFVLLTMCPTLTPTTMLVPSR